MCAWRESSRPQSGDDEPCFSAIHSVSEGARSRDVSFMGMVGAMRGEEYLAEPEAVETSPPEEGYGSANVSHHITHTATTPQRPVVTRGGGAAYTSPVLQDTTPAPAPRGGSFHQIGALDSSTSASVDEGCHALSHADDAGLEAPHVMLPHEVSDRRGLMRTITTLSTQVQRLTLQLRRAPPLSEEHVRSFDPLIADAHIRRLNETLAQQSLLREMDRQRIADLEGRIASRAFLERDLEEKLQTFRERVLTQEARLDAAHDELQAAAGLRAEVEQLRATEVRLNRALEGLHSYDTESDPHSVRLVDTRQPSPMQPTGDEAPIALERAFLEMDETAARQDLLLECVFEPMYVAFDAGITWCREVERMRERAEEAGAHDTQVSAQESTTLSERDALVAESEIESLRHQLLFAKMQLDRAERAVEHERRRNETLARENFERLEVLAKQQTRTREAMLNAVLPELQGRLMQAFRDGQRCRSTVPTDLPLPAASSTNMQPAGVVNTPRDNSNGGAKKYRKTAASAPSTPRPAGGDDHHPLTHATPRPVTPSASTRHAAVELTTKQLGSLHRSSLPNDSIDEAGLTADRSRARRTDSSVDDREVSVGARYLIGGSSQSTPPRRLEMQ